MKDLLVTVESILAQMNSLELSTPEQSVEAQEFIKRIKATKREVTDILAEKYSKDIARYKKAKASYDAYTDEKKRLFSKLDSAENILKGKLAAVERERREQLRKAEAAAREAAQAAALVAYHRPGDIFKGSWCEVGAALARDVPVFAVGIEDYTIAAHPGVMLCPNIDTAMALAMRAHEKATRLKR